MPNRIIKESICTSEEIDSLSSTEEVFFYRLMVNCDDYGCMDARPRILLARLFPLKKLSESFIVSSLDKLNSLNLIGLYEVNGRPYLHMTSWEEHQQIRAHKHKYPFIDDENAKKITAENIGYQMISDDINSENNWTDINGYQMISDDIRCVPNPIQSESNPNPNPNHIIARNDNLMDGFDDEDELYKNDERVNNKKTKPKKERTIDDTPVMFKLMLNDKSYYDVHQSEVDRYKGLYPNVNIEQEFRNMIGWIESNPSKRKTNSGIKKFINSWLSKEQNKYHGNNYRQQQPILPENDPWKGLNTIDDI